MSREIIEHSYSVTPIEVGIEFADNPTNWLARKAKEYGLTTLLAYADDGVIWGQMVGEQLALSSSAFPQISPLLRAITLQQARLFGEHAELLVWRDGDENWHGRLLDDKGTEKVACRFDEPQLQWGDRVEAQKAGFTLVREGQKGLRHAVPLPAADIPFDPPGKKDDRWQPLRLGVRHYLERDEDGTLIIVQGRLTGLWTEERKEGQDE
jgi:CRISPR-associated protein (TIGR03984 family)